MFATAKNIFNNYMFIQKLNNTNARSKFKESSKHSTYKLMCAHAGPRICSIKLIKITKSGGIVDLCTSLHNPYKRAYIMTTNNIPIKHKH